MIFKFSFSELVHTILSLMGLNKLRFKSKMVKFYRFFALSPFRLVSLSPCLQASKSRYPKKKRKVIIQLTILFLPTFTVAQKMTISASTGFIVAEKETPFLLRANQYGLVPLEANFGYLNTTIDKDYEKNSFADWGFGVEVQANAGIESQVFLLPEAYLKGKIGIFDLYVGRKKEIQGLVDTLGTMGSFIWSGNALPMPKIDIGFRDFVYLKKGGLLSVKGNFAHGWFGQGDSVHNVMLHQKSFYIKVGKPDWKVHLIAGANHQVQWGGRPNTPFVDRISGQTIDKFPSGFLDYLSVVTGVSMTDATGLDWSEQEGVPGNEAGNRMGNHLGTVDIGLELYPMDGLNIKIYRQSIYEDGSLFYLSNITDGLSGISFAYKKEYRLTFEYLDTRNQGGETGASNTIPELRGRDNYLNNSIYRDAWTYKGNIIGTPIFTTYKDRMDQFNPMTSGSSSYIYNNRVQAFSVKALYKIYGLRFVTHALVSNNLGTYRQPIQKGQFSFLQSAQYDYDRWSFNLQLAVDNGEYLPNGMGADLGVVYRILN